MKSDDWNGAVAALSTADRAALRRAAGVWPVETGAYAAALRCLRMPPSDYEYAALCMECLWRADDQPQTMPMEECLALMSNRQGASGSLPKRVEAALGTSWTADGFLLGKIASLVRLIRSDRANIKLDFSLLAEDLWRWNRENRVVQKKWLDALYAFPDINKEEEKNAD